MAKIDEVIDTHGGWPDAFVTGSGTRVYVTFLHEGTVALHPAVCTGPRYKTMSEGSTHLRKNISAEELGEAALRIRRRCKTK